jgi:pSer/pThr/pTyr-binding forkhead associated (FHA) protein
MSYERLLELARTLPREEFAKSNTRWFLIILDTGEEEPPSSFETVDVSATPRVLLSAKPPSTLVHEIVKAEGNPYPDRISVGRARNCDIVLRHPSVSKLHGHFLPRPEGQIDFADVGSQVGTRVNGHMLEPNQPARLGPGFILSIGRVIARIADARAAWDLLRAQGHDEGSIPPPRSSVPASAPAPRSSVPGSAPAPRSSVPASAPAPRSSVPASAPAPRTVPGLSSAPATQRSGVAPSSAERSGIRRADPEAAPGEGNPRATRRG